MAALEFSVGGGGGVAALDNGSTNSYFALVVIVHYLSRRRSGVGRGRRRARGRSVHHTTLSRHNFPAVPANPIMRSFPATTFPTTHARCDLFPPQLSRHHGMRSFPAKIQKDSTLKHQRHHHPSQKIIFMGLFINSTLKILPCLQTHPSSLLPIESSHSMVSLFGT